MTVTYKFQHALAVAKWLLYTYTRAQLTIQLQKSELDNSLVCFSCPVNPTSCAIDELVVVEFVITECRRQRSEVPVTPNGLV